MSSSDSPTDGVGSDPPNVLWVMADQHNAKCTSWGAFPTDVHTPHLQELADDGVRFDTAICQNPICTPSRASYLTGQYPSNHGIYGLAGDGGIIEAPTLFDALASRGYRTGAFGKLHTPEGLLEGRLDDSWSHFDYGSDLQRDQFSPYLRERGLLDDRDDVGREEAPLRDARASNLPTEHQPETVAVRRAIGFLEEALADDRPFCTWVSLHRPHQAYTPAQKFWDLYEDVELPPTAFEDLSDKPPNQTNLDPDEESPRAVFEEHSQRDLLRRKLRGYLGCISMVDDCLGRLLDFLERAGVRDNTIVIYCSDHGDFAAEHGFLEKAPGISYDAITRVPFVWSWPGRFPEGVVVEDLVETVDMVPTLLSLIDDAAVPAADGMDFSGHLTGAEDPPEREYAVTENPWTKTVHTGDQKLTVYPPGFFGANSEEYLEFYDLREDLWEETNLAVAENTSTDAIEDHLAHLREFLQTQRRATSTVSVDRATGPLSDGSVPPRDLAAHLAEHGLTHYL